MKKFIMQRTHLSPPNGQHLNEIKRKLFTTTQSLPFADKNAEWLIDCKKRFLNSFRIHVPILFVVKTENLLCL